MKKERVNREDTEVSIEGHREERLEEFKSSRKTGRKALAPQRGAERKKRTSLLAMTGSPEQSGQESPKAPLALEWKDENAASDCPDLYLDRRAFTDDRLVARRASDFPRRSK